MKKSIQTKKKNQNSDDKMHKNESSKKSLLNNKLLNNCGRRSGSMPCEGTKQMKNC